MQPRYRRLFIGISVSPLLKKRLLREVESWPKDATIPIHNENLHILIHHLGFLLEEDIFDVSEKIREAVKDIDAFDAPLDMIDRVESDENPKEIWLTGPESQEFLALKQAITLAFTNKTHELKTFSPHVILAKIKKARWLKLDTVPNIKRAVNFVEPVDEVVLYESLELDGKRTYEPIDTFPLQ
jgi:2'-5' RNA ligase